MVPLQDSKEKGQGRFAAAVGFGYTFAAGMAVFAAMGYALDRKFGGGEKWTLTGIFLGLLFGAYELWKLVRAWDDRDEPDPPRHEKS